MIAMILGFLKGVPIKAWGALAAVVIVMALVATWNKHERNIAHEQDVAVIATLQGQLSLAQAANNSAGAAIKTLQDKLAECEAGRVVDKAAQDDAQKAYAKAIELFKAGDAAARARTAKLLTTTCKDWAAMPACGVTVVP